ncbi:MAG: hypothetical protein GC191_00675 [Azospirillum sp.]|nr:hypothetical protein [Azospirillum sp.]
MSATPPPGKSGLLDELRGRIRRLEGSGGGHGQGLALGIAAIDRVLPDGGLAQGRLHEVSPATPDDADAAAAFAALVLARLICCRSQAVWVSRRHDLYGPGLAGLGVSAEHLVMVRARRDTEVLWVMEEALRCRGLGVVLGEVDTLALVASRRLQLAAESGGVTGLLLRPAAQRPAASTAVTRWRIAALPSRPRPGEPGVGAARWRVELTRCRGGQPCTWILSADSDWGVAEEDSCEVETVSLSA